MISWAVKQDGEEMIGQDCGLLVFFSLMLFLQEAVLHNVNILLLWLRKTA